MRARMALEIGLEQRKAEIADLDESLPSLPDYFASQSLAKASSSSRARDGESSFPASRR